MKERTHEARPLMPQEAQELERRALMAWLATREARANGTLRGLSAQTLSTGTVQMGAMHWANEGAAKPPDTLRHFVAIQADGVVLAVYRVRNDNRMLRRLKRWPLALGAAAGVDFEAPSCK